MSTTTSNLGLFKYDVASDAQAAFSITNALNNNWDKIDTFAGNKFITRASATSYGNSSTPVYVNSSGQITTCSYSIPTSTGLTATTSLAENGYIKFSNSFTINWTKISVDHSKDITTTSVTFSKSFNTAALNIVTSNPPNVSCYGHVDMGSITKTGFSFKTSRVSTASAINFPYYIHSLGY